MYPYHNKIRQRINNGEYIGCETGKGEFALILHFNTYPFTRPIRPHSVYRYLDLIGE